MKLTNLLVGALVLTGCASDPKPVMPDNKYGGYAASWAAIDQCGTQGDMEPVLVAYGKKRLEQEMYGYVFDMGRMNAAIQSEVNMNREVSRENCNKMSSLFAGLRDEYDRNSRSNSSSNSSQASCYTTPYGNVTNCVSY